MILPQRQDKLLTNKDSTQPWTPTGEFFANGGGIAETNLLHPKEDEFCIMTSEIQKITDSPKSSTGIPMFINLPRRRTSNESCSKSSQSSNTSFSRSPGDYSIHSQQMSQSNQLPQHLQENRLTEEKLYNADMYSPNMYNSSCAKPCSEIWTADQLDLTQPNNILNYTPGNRLLKYKPLVAVTFMCFCLYTGSVQKFSTAWKSIEVGSLSNIVTSLSNDGRQQINDFSLKDKDNSLRVRRTKSIQENKNIIKKHKALPQTNIYATFSKGIYNPELLGYKDTWVDHDYKHDIPVFWHVPKAGGSTIKDIVGACHGLTIANEDGVLDGHALDTDIKVVHIHGLGDTKFVNVDTTTIPGIKRAIKLDLGSSGLAELVITPFVHDAEHIFTADVKHDKVQQTGRLFATFRHPVARAVSLFKYLQYADWEPTYNPEIKTWNLEEYAQSNHIENNWMTRYLSNTLNGELTSAHLHLAMDILRRKFLVGLIDQLETSMKRFEAFFGWKYMLNPTVQETCRESLFTVGTNANRNSRIAIPEKGSYLYNLIAQQNLFDLELYAYIETLFNEQAQYVEDIPEDYRLIDTHCSKCIESNK